VPALPPDEKPVEGVSDGLYTMAVAARLRGMPPQTLRKYELAGLIRPSRPSGNQRLYSEMDVRRPDRTISERRPRP
jgi:predicted site-specific integrase-resolvase